MSASDDDMRPVMVSARLSLECDCSRSAPSVFFASKVRVNAVCAREYNSASRPPTSFAPVGDFTGDGLNVSEGDLDGLETCVSDDDDSSSSPSSSSSSLEASLDDTSETLMAFAPLSADVRPDTGLLAPELPNPSVRIRRRRYATCSRISSGWSHHHPAPDPSHERTPRNPPCFAAAPVFPPRPTAAPPRWTLRTISSEPASAEDLTCASTAESSWTCATPAPPPSLQ
mmetsp:Transcript_7946/g.36190  ORF Transcript_7946/g.36190 Transcript_7946/m.36190 type:complete len:228 (-) Transcript_7946:2293-2976(-)